MFMEPALSAALFGFFLLILLKVLWPSTAIEGPVLDEIKEFVDRSLKGYPDRTQYSYSGTHVWSCHSKLFSFEIYTGMRGGSCLFSVFFRRDFPYRLTVSRSSKFQELVNLSRKETVRFRVTKSRNEKTKALLDSIEIPSILEKLSFYDSLQVGKYGVKGEKRIESVSDLADWPKALGASITFIRFLLDFAERGVQGNQEESVCPYCRGAIGKQDQLVSCRECRTLHHQECWSETDRCSVFGCGSKKELEL